ncbi:MAG: 50S ribosome-binding GTPase, partial [Gammaproteobacteria bacterium]|nr:50S ribosome-binding GTPase [Gammaproteobacteria bacterium]
MLPVIALVGRPNVGKSTLFNRLTGTRDALVADYPGLTRDRQYGFARLPAELRAAAGADSLIVVDTGGVTGNQGELDLQMSKQVESAVLESHVVILMVDGESGMTAGDENVTELIRRTGKPVVLVVNKTEGRAADESAAEFHALGIGDPLAISATRGDRVQGMLETALRLCPPAKQDSLAQRDADGTRIAVIGKPNVGKSTLINRL